MRINVLFPGQGAQYPNMGMDFYETFETYRNIVDKTSEALGEDLLRILQDEDELKETRNSQLAIFSMGYGIGQLIKEAGVKIDSALGLSLGEYSALAMAKSLTLDQTLYLLKKRSQFMEEATQERETFLMAVSFLDKEKVQEVLDCEDEVYLANENAPNQNVVGGLKTRLEDIKGKMMAAGAKKVTSLMVSGAFHTPFMETASKAFKEELAKVDIKFPKIPVLSNFKGDYYEEMDDMREILAKHISHGVKLVKGLQKLESQDEDYHLIIGPGKAFASILKQNKIPGRVLKVGTVEEFYEAITILKEKTNE